MEVAEWCCMDSRDGPSSRRAIPTDCSYLPPLRLNVHHVFTLSAACQRQNNMPHLLKLATMVHVPVINLQSHIDVP